MNFIKSTYNGILDRFPMFGNEYGTDVENVQWIEDEMDTVVKKLKKLKVEDKVVNTLCNYFDERIKGRYRYLDQCAEYSKWCDDQISLFREFYDEKRDYKTIRAPAMNQIMKVVNIEQTKKFGALIEARDDFSMTPSDEPSILALSEHWKHVVEKYILMETDIFAKTVHSFSKTMKMHKSELFAVIHESRLKRLWGELPLDRLTVREREIFGYRNSLSNYLRDLGTFRLEKVVYDVLWLTKEYQSRLRFFENIHVLLTQFYKIMSTFGKLEIDSKQVQFLFYSEKDPYVLTDSSLTIWDIQYVFVEIATVLSNKDRLEDEVCGFDSFIEYARRIVGKEDEFIHLDMFFQNFLDSLVQFCIVRINRSPRPSEIPTMKEMREVIYRIFTEEEDTTDDFLTISSDMEFDLLGVCPITLYLDVEYEEPSEFRASKVNFLTLFYQRYVDNFGKREIGVTDEIDGLNVSDIPEDLELSFYD